MLFHLLPGLEASRELAHEAESRPANLNPSDSGRFSLPFYYYYITLLFWDTQRVAPLNR